MLEALAVSFGLVAGIETRRLAALVFSITLPFPAALLLGIHWWRERTRASARSVLFCEAMSGELRSGASSRQAFHRSAESVDADVLAKLAVQGAPFSDLARTARNEFPDVGTELAAVIERVAWLGAPAADLFDEISILALAQVEVEQEIATATAPAKATAAVLLFVPIAAIVFALSRGDVGEYLGSGGQRISAVAGLLLIALGVSVAGLMMRRAR